LFVPWRFDLQKSFKIRFNFKQLSTLTANVSETKQAVEKWNSKWSTAANRPAEQKKLVKSDTQAKKFCRLIPTYRKSALRAISNNFTRWPIISLQRTEISSIASDQLQPSPVGRINLVNFGPLTKQFHCLISIYPKSTVCILHMQMHLTLGYMTLLAGEFHPLKFPPNQT